MHRNVAAAGRGRNPSVGAADLVRVDAVARVTRNGDGSATLGLSDGSVVHVSRRRAPDVWALLEG
jgi:hypothetical protein